MICYHLRMLEVHQLIAIEARAYVVYHSRKISVKTLIFGHQWNLKKNNHWFMAKCVISSHTIPVVYVFQCNFFFKLSHWGRMTHICVNKVTIISSDNNKVTIISSDNGLSPERRQAIVWTNAEILLIGTLGIIFSEIVHGNSNILCKKCTWKCRLRNGVHFASMCLRGLSVLWHTGHRGQASFLWYIRLSYTRIKFVQWLTHLIPK